MAHELLVTADELPYYGLASEFLEGFEPGVVNAQLQAATDEAIGRMAPAVVPPLISWGSDLRSAVGSIAVYELKSISGLASIGANVGDENLLVRAQQKRAWLDSVGAGAVDPQDLVDSSIDAATGGEMALAALSDNPRGF